jgi:hypothetical protein
MTAEELKSAIDAHRKWLAGKVGGTRANLIGCELIGIYLLGADLSGVDMPGSNLSGSYLSGCNLLGANLTGSNLSGCNLIGCNLARADLHGANLSNANLSNANLHGANLSNANLAGVNGFPIIRPVADFRGSLLAAVSAKGCNIDMGNWHTCETVHCLAGWIVTIHPEGKLLESIYCTSAAAALILHACGEQIPDFHDTGEGADKRAVNWLKTGKQEDPIAA